ncbi:MAG: hypothetical protein Q8O52_06495 [Sulfuritalea sp.]|nr:hypothetical protein [Sulfuritalea sp.]
MPVTRRKISGIKQHGKTGIECGHGRRLGQVEPLFIDIHEKRLAAQPDKGCGKGIMAGMAEDQKACAAPQFLTPRNKNLPPAMRAQGRPQIGATAGDDHAAFVELGECIAQRAARCACLFPRLVQGIDVAPVERRLGFWKSQPDQRIEQVMPVVGPRRDLASQESPLFIGICGGSRRHKAQRRAAARDQPTLAGGSIQQGDIRSSGGKPGPQESREGMEIRPGRGHGLAAEVGAGAAAPAAAGASWLL